MTRRAVVGVAIAWALVVAWPLAAAEPQAQVLFRASASASAVHGFYDHEDLFPVPLVNVSVPYAEASMEPGPTTASLGSFLWDPQAAELGTILCVLSEGAFCQLPDYPFQARASHPASGEEAQPPTLALEQPGSPVRVRAAHEDAEATARGARASASVAALDAVPMTPAQAASARTLAAATVPLGGSLRVTPWLVEVRAADSIASVRTDPNGAVAESRSEIHGFRLLGGVITAAVVSGESRSAVGEPTAGRARAAVIGLRVGGVPAEIGPGGIRIADEDLGAEEVRTLEGALDRALADVGINIGPGRERVRRSERSVSSLAYAFSLDFRRENVPEQFPEGTRGADVLRVPVGVAASEAAVAEILPPVPEVDTPTGEPGETAPGVVAGAGGVPGAPVAPVGEVVGDPSVPEPIAAAPAAAILDLGVPMAVVVGVAVAAIALVLGLTWLKLNEVLTE